jgi:hypothetical protein
LAIVSLPTFAGPGPVEKNDWKPISPAHLALKAPMVEKDADAEAIFWEVWVEDEVDTGTVRTVLRHYLRIKVFTERGRELQSSIDLKYRGNNKIDDIAARTIKPDGSIVELKKDAIFERTVVKSDDLKIKAKSFALPGVEPGCIIEYRWKEVRRDQLAQYARLHFQRDIPVQLVTYFVKPLSLPGFDYKMHYKSFYSASTPFAPEKDGYFSTKMTNVPAFREEPDMPPEDQCRP